MSSSTVELVDDTYTTIDESWCFLQVQQLQPSNSITAICCGFVVQLVSTVDKFLTDIVRRAVRLTNGLFTAHELYSANCTLRTGVRDL